MGRCYCARVVKAVQCTRVDKSETGLVIAEAKELSRLLDEWRITQLKRDCNQVAASTTRAGIQRRGELCS
jgi:hypothetical protein